MKIHYVFAGSYIGCGLFGRRWLKYASTFADDVTCASCRRSVPFMNARASRDSGSDRNGEDSRSEAECEASQSGGEAVSPKGGSDA